ncbi:hypothetical protein [Clostridium sp. FP1]|uniref:hypothetical protein n=1 Tax=Clostridium sp. FP1 TaxID=2724076 RepID=UPI001CC97C32|nr:hypothetical protein [Clostridium sp. FP1]MBZ9633734.1 hypothetical protein [Clostridium sp. FP1]
MVNIECLKILTSGVWAVEALDRYNKPVNFSVRQENPKNKKTFRCAVVYISKLREKNLDIDFMVDDNVVD